MKMNFLYFHQHFGTPKGAGGIRSYAMARKIIEHGHSVTMICGKGARGHTGLGGEFRKGMRRGNVDGIDVIELDLPYSNNMGFLKRATVFVVFALRSVRIALKEECDFVIATSTPLTAGIPGIFARWFRGKPFIFEVRDLWPELPREMGVIKNPIILWMMGALEWLTYRSANRLIGLSPGIIDGISKKNANRNNVELIPNGCDLDIFDPIIPPWRPKEVGDHELMVVFTGAHGKANGLDAVLDAAKVLKNRNVSNVRFVLVGDGMEKKKLISRAKADRLDNVIFLDLMPKDKLAELLSGADVGLQVLANVPAFYYGTSPNKFFDYISSGTAVLTNYPGWIADMVDKENIGWCVQPDAPEAFADALIEAASDRDAVRQFGENARGLAEREFDRKKLSKKFVHFCLNSNF